MRTLIIAVLLFASAPVALAQPRPERPATPAPAATASFDERESWCQKYAAWFVARVPERGPRPVDVRPTQRLENELTYCKLDPQQYERETRAELARTVEPG